MTKRIKPLLDAMQRIWIHRAVDLFTHIIGPLMFVSAETEKEEKQDIMLLEIQLYNFIFRVARQRNEENAWSNAVYKVFGHKNWDRLPDTEADPPDPRWLKVDELMDEYCVNREQREEKEEKQFIKK